VHGDGDAAPWASVECLEDVEVFAAESVAQHDRVGVVVFEFGEAEGEVLAAADAGEFAA
jgi:hypothetical protein